MKNIFIGFTTSEGTVNKYINFENLKEANFTYQREDEVKEGTKRKAKAELYYKNSDSVHKIKGTYKLIKEIEYIFNDLIKPVQL